MDSAGSNASPVAYMNSIRLAVFIFLLVSNYPPLGVEVVMVGPEVQKRLGLEGKEGKKLLSSLLRY